MHRGVMQLAVKRHHAAHDQPTPTVLNHSPSTPIQPVVKATSEPSAMSWDYIMKFVICGEAGVGKTSILYRLTDERFLTTPDPTIGVEFGSKILQVVSPTSSSGWSSGPEDPVSPPEGGEEDAEAKVVGCKISVWDVAGSPSFRSVTRSYYRGAAGALLVYDVCRRETFEQVSDWLADIRANADPEVAIILIGNKSDLLPPPSSSTDASSPSPSSSDDPASTAAPPQHPSPSSHVSTAEARAFAARENLLFLETSAKTGSNVPAAFNATARAILRKILEGGLDAGKGAPGRRGEGKGIKLGEEGRAKGGCC